MDDHSLKLLELDRVTASIAARAASEAGARRLAAWGPIADPGTRAAEVALLRAAIRRAGEPGEWCAVGPRDPEAWLEAGREALDGPGLVEVLGWLEAGRTTRRAWEDDEARARHAALAARVDALPALEPLRARLAAALEPDGRLADGASPALRRLRAAIGDGERELEERLTRWAHGFGAESYVTRHGDRFVALVPAAGFPRRRAIVHDVSGSGQSLFVEPLEACEANNRLIESRSALAAEEQRILEELSAAVREAREPVLALIRGLVHLDTARARAVWAREVGGTALEPGGERLHLNSARHPLLALGTRRADLVPLDLDLAPPGKLLLVSGPNMGGKTVLLKTVGLAVVLAHAALPVPAAEGSAVPEIDAVLADLGDEQSVDRGLSTFAAHVVRLRAMAERAGGTTLLLCDELGAGTDPEEGGALGRALVEHFAARGAWGIVTTHLGSLKRVAGEIAGVVNGSLAFDRERLRPLYRFQPGIPGASHALAVAEQLGVPAEVVARARALAPESAAALERLLAELETARRQADEAARALAAARAEAERAAAEHRDGVEAARASVAELRRRLTAESEAVLARARELWQTVQRDARRAEKRREDAAATRAGIEGIEAEMESLQRAAGEALAALGGSPTPTAPPRLEAGARVRDRDLGVEAELVSGPDAEGRVLLRRGSWNIHSHVSRLEAAVEAAGATSPRASAAWEPGEVPPGLDVDLRGLEADEAVAALDRALDRAVLGGFRELRIVHGIGRGVLRAVVERHLRGHPQVASQRLGGANEGGRGATVAELR